MSLRPLASAVDSWQPGGLPAGDALSSIVAAWPEIVGARIAGNSAPLALERETLVIGTPSSAWSQQLEFFAPQIIEQLAGRTPNTVKRLRFRSGRFRRPRPRRLLRTAPTRRRRRADPISEPARDLYEAFDRVRRSISEARRRAPRICSRCGAPLERDDAICAPCSGLAETARRLELERMLFNAPWLSADELCVHVAGLSFDEIAAVRRNLLRRWWVVLERARRAGRALSSRERQVASSYVLLQSGLPPDRITPAIVRNLLGDELEAQLSGA